MQCEVVAAFDQEIQTELLEDVVNCDIPLIDEEAFQKLIKSSHLNPEEMDVQKKCHHLSNLLLSLIQKFFEADGGVANLLHALEQNQQTI